jgi:hypothetical protein
MALLCGGVADFFYRLSKGNDFTSKKNYEARTIILQVRSKNSLHSLKHRARYMVA